MNIYDVRYIIRCRQAERARQRAASVIGLIIIIFNNNNSIASSCPRANCRQSKAVIYIIEYLTKKINEIY